MRMRVAKKIARGHFRGRLYAKGLASRALALVLRDMLRKIRRMRSWGITVLPFVPHEGEPLRGADVDGLWIDEGAFGVRR